jgi:hypothetical protein
VASDGLKMDLRHWLRSLPVVNAIVSQPSSRTGASSRLRVSDELRETIDQAIDSAAERAKERRTPTSIEILNAAHRWKGDKEIRIHAPPASKGNQPTLLMYDEHQLAWRAVMLPVGSSWRVVPDQPALWTPDSERPPTT